jgi:hypothetical protein
MRAKRSLDVNKLANSPIAAEALTNGDQSGGYDCSGRPLEVRTSIN